MGPNSGGGKKKGGGGGAKVDRLGRPLNFGNFKNGKIVAPKAGGGRGGGGGKGGGKGGGDAKGSGGGRGGGKGGGGRGGGKGGRGGAGGGGKKEKQQDEDESKKSVAVVFCAVEEAKVRRALEGTSLTKRFVALHFEVGARVSAIYENDEVEEEEWYDATVVGADESGVDVTFDDYAASQSDFVSLEWAQVRKREPKKKNARGRTPRGGETQLKVPKMAKASPLREQRESLPAFSHRQSVVDAIANNSVVVVEGDTGCGKTTQVPQFVLEDAAAAGRECSIIVAQPRRISALGVAERVAAERGEAVGRSVGYSIRLDSKTSEDTCLLFCTTGILMRKLSENPTLEGTTHVFVDEVHERTVESDFLLMVLRDLITQRDDLKIVLMSATLDADLFASYFKNSKTKVPTLKIPGRAFTVSAFYLEHALALTEHRVRPGADWAKKKQPGGSRPARPPSAPMREGDWQCGGCGAAVFASKKACFKCGAAKGQAPPPSSKPPAPSGDPASLPCSELDESGLARRYPTFGGVVANALAVLDHDLIDYELVVKLIHRLASSTGPEEIVDWARGRGFLRDGKQQAADENDETGLADAILVFLPGFKEIETLHEALLATPRFGAEPQRSWVLPLHSLLPPEEQKRVFERPPKTSSKKASARKVVLATNIAETAITIDDCSFVIDCGRMKEKRFDAVKRMESLEDVGVCRSNAKQRRGRAGRCRPGVAFHLMTSRSHDVEAPAHQAPEVRRVPLERLVLTIKALGYQKRAAEVLASLLEPPETAAVSRALRELVTLGALEIVNKNEALTALGAHLSKLPCDARIGKFILLGSIFGAIDETLTIAATLTSRSPFVAPFAKRDEADACKRHFAGSTQSDHLAVLAAYSEFDRTRGNAKYDFARRNFLGIKSLQQIAALKRQLLELLSDAGFAPSNLRNRKVESRGRQDGGSDGVRASLKKDSSDEDWNCPKCKGLVFGFKPKCFKCGAAKPKAEEPDYDERIASLAAAKEEVENGAPEGLLKALLCAALFPQVAVVEDAVGKGAPKLKIQDEDSSAAGGLLSVALHPSSVNSRLAQLRFESKYLVYAEKLKTTQIYIRDCTPVSPFALMLFGGQLSTIKQDGLTTTLAVDGWMRFRLSMSLTKLIIGLRRQLDGLLRQKIENPKLELSAAGDQVIDAVVTLLAAPPPI